MLWCLAGMLSFPIVRDAKAEDSCSFSPREKQLERALQGVWLSHNLNIGSNSYDRISLDSSNDRFAQRSFFHDSIIQIIDPKAMGFLDKYWKVMNNKFSIWWEVIIDDMSNIWIFIATTREVVSYNKEIEDYSWKIYLVIKGVRADWSVLFSIVSDCIWRTKAFRID